MAAVAVERVGRGHDQAQAQHEDREEHDHHAARTASTATAAPPAAQQQEHRRQREHERHQADQHPRQREDQLRQVDLPDQALVGDDADRAIVQAGAQEAPGDHPREQEERVVLDLVSVKSLRKHDRQASPSSRAGSERPEETQDRSLIADPQLLHDHVLNDRPEPHELLPSSTSRPAKDSARAEPERAEKIPRAGPSARCRTSMSGCFPIAWPSISIGIRARPGH